MKTNTSLAETSCPKRMAWYLRIATAIGLLLLPAAVQAQFDYTTNDGAITITGYTGPGGDVTIPSTINGRSVTSIGDNAFYEWTSLTSITIPDSVTSIGDCAFAECTSLTSVYFQGNAPNCGPDVFCFHLTPTVYYLPGTTGWGATFGGRPTIRVGPPELGVNLYAGLSITGAFGTVYSIEYVTDLAQTNNPSAWRCLEYLQLLASPFLWADKSVPATGQRFYRAVAMQAPTNMVFIPPGTFRMGSPTNEVDRSDWEGPQMAVTISRGYWMGKYEVTQRDYLSVMGYNPSYFSRNYGYAEDLNRPVEELNWSEATTYCAALTERERLAGRIGTNSVYRLPTEAEWEYACRAWTSTRFSYGDDPGYTNLTKYAWYEGNSGNMTHPVGQKLPNPWGLYDMHGNVYEWCQDWWSYTLSGGIAVDPQGPARGEGVIAGGSGALRVIRGGGWHDSGGNGSLCRSASRRGGDPFYLWQSDIGFRVVLAPGQP